MEKGIVGLSVESYDDNGNKFNPAFWPNITSVLSNQLQVRHNMTVLSLVIILVGIVFIGIGAYISLYEWKQEQERLAREMISRGEGVVTEAASVGEVLDGLAKLAEALKNHKLGMQLIILGITLITTGGILGGVGCLVSGT
jgi:hypothetical protein